MWKNFLTAHVGIYGVEARYLLKLQSSGMVNGMSVW